MKKQRLDVLLVSRGLVESRSLAQRMVMAGQVRVDGQVVFKPSTNVSPEAEISLDQGSRFVSRGGEKLQAALDAFDVHVKGKVCADVGASTGGFTDALLQAGAQKIYAIDVGKGILDWKLRNDPRVIVMEGVNARHVESLPEPVSLVTIDASFISLKILLPVVKHWLPEGGGQVVALIKPQFEVGRKIAARGKGVVRDPQVHRAVLLDVLAAAQAEGFAVVEVIQSPLLGPKGNAEFLAHLEFGGENLPVRSEQELEALLPVQADEQE